MARNGTPPWSAVYGNPRSMVRPRATTIPMPMAPMPAQVSCTLCEKCPGIVLNFYINITSKKCNSRFQVRGGLSFDGVFTMFG